MQSIFKSIAIIGKYMSPSADARGQTQAQLVELAAFLAGQNIDICVEEKTAQYAELTQYKTLKIDQIGKYVDLAIVLGGDGTMLSVARALLNDGIPLVGVNRGRFGFLTDISAKDMLPSITKLLGGAFTKEQRMLLSAQVLRDGEQVHQDCALNDVVVKSGLRLIELEVKIDGQFVHKQRSDGLILSTPTGTTAYSLSAGGPIFYPNLEAIALVPVSPHTLSNRPIAIHSGSQIEITVINAHDSHLSIDGQLRVPLLPSDKILVKRAEQSVSLLHPLDYCYYAMLRNKLHWG